MTILGEESNRWVNEHEFVFNIAFLRLALDLVDERADSNRLLFLIRIFYFVVGKLVLKPQTDSEFVASVTSSTYAPVC